MPFGPLRIAYDDRVLHPRPWTVAQAHWVADLAADMPAGPLLELCSGAGHIGLLAAHLTGRALTCVDISAAACELARRNAAAAGLADRVVVREGDMSEVLAPEERFVVVIADPPWVESHRVADHPQDPVHAIDGGRDGIDEALTCLAVGAAHLEPEGVLVLQQGDLDQVRRVEDRSTSGLRLQVVRQEAGGVLSCWMRP